MKTIRNLILFIVCFFICGCGAFIEYQTGKTYTNEENIANIEYAQQIQEVYWLCVDNSESIDTLKDEWVKVYGENVVDKGIELYKNNNK